MTIGHRRSPSHRRDRYTISGPLILNQIQAAFRRDEIRRTSPTPQDEMGAGMSYFHETIWKGVPKFLRRVDTTLKNIGINECVPYNAPLIQFSSWMGGDRDGNPRVTPEVTQDVCLLARMMAANLHYSQIEDLMFELSMWRCSDELRVRAEELHRSSKRDAKHYIEFWKQVPASEPYRVILSDVRDKLYQTRERSRHLLAHDISDIPEEGTFTNIEQDCEGRCMRSFHATVEAGSESMCESLCLSDELVEQYKKKFCENCQKKQHQCFSCGELGSSDKLSGAEKVGDTTRKPLNNTGSTKVSKSFTDGNKFSLGNSVYNLISKGSKTKSRKDTPDSEYKQTLTNKPVAKEMRDSLSLDADAK
ncbi:unnamed protein product [Camellia sinensis]